MEIVIVAVCRREVSILDIKLEGFSITFKVQFGDIKGINHHFAENLDYSH